MYDVLADLAGELVATVVAGVVAAVLAVGGLVAELNGLQQFGAGETVLGLWFTALGALALYVGVVVVGYGTVLGRDAGA